MKKIISIHLVIIISAAINIISAANLAKQIRAGVTKISDSYVEKNPVKSTKKAIAVIDFKETSPNAQGQGLGATLREMVSREVLNSQVFFLLDRDNLTKIFKEMELSQTGVVDESKSIEAGKLAGAELFLSGSIGEIQNEFIVSLKLTDVETSNVLATAEIKIPQKDLLAKKRELAFEYIAQYGLGINFQGSMVFMKSPDPHQTILADVFMNYRPNLSLNFKLGISNLNFNASSSQTPIVKLYPMIEDSFSVGTPKYNHSNVTLPFNGATMSLTGPYFGFDYNWSPSEVFTLGLGVSFSFGSPVMEQQFNNGVYNTQPLGTPTQASLGIFNIVQEMKPLFLSRFEVKPQYFISPRMTVGLYLAVFVANKLQVQRSVINNDYQDYPSEGGVDLQAGIKEKYFGMNPKFFGTGAGTIDDLQFMGAIAAGLSFNFYF